MIDVRPMQHSDLEGVGEATHDAFRELSARTGFVYTEPDQVARERYRRVRERLLDSDPRGQWVAVDDDRAIVGVASAIRREHLWGLSLLVVRPSAQGRGVGRRLLERALETAEHAAAALILSSSDPAAIRRYARAGFALAPTLSADGPVRGAALAAPAGVREGGSDDLELTERVDRAVRGAGRRGDLALLLELGQRLLIADSGYAVVRGNSVQLLAATDPGVAADLLRAALLAVPEGQAAQVHNLTGGQQWAWPVLLDAGLHLRPDGPLCWRGEVGPLAPYIPSGAYL